MILILYPSELPLFLEDVGIAREACERRVALAASSPRAAA